MAAVRKLIQKSKTLMSRPSSLWEIIQLLRPKYRHFSLRYLIKSGSLWPLSSNYNVAISEMIGRKLCFRCCIGTNNYTPLNVPSISNFTLQIWLIMFWLVWPCVILLSLMVGFCCCCRCCFLRFLRRCACTIFGPQCQGKLSELWRFFTNSRSNWRLSRGVVF